MRNNPQKRNFKIERNRLYPETGHDTYRMEKKYQEPTICRHCGSLFTKGRWTWDDLPEQAHEANCPACKRIQDQYPAGLLTLSGTFLHAHENELLNMVRNISKMEVSAHPLERLMNIRHKDGELNISTTGIHLARRLGDALQRAYQGELNYSYEGDNLLRISWNRDS